MAKKKLSDADAKAILLKWPGVTDKLWDPPTGAGSWVRAQPKDGKASGPKIYTPGADLFATQPDGLWAHFNGTDSCDVVAIEVCGSIQNLNDKRSRYQPASHSLVLEVSEQWSSEQRAGRGGTLKSRRDWAGTLPRFKGKVRIPIRHLRVLYALKNDDYGRWCPGHTPTGYEFFIPHSSLDSYSSPKMQEFLRRMSIASQFYLQR